MQPGKTSRGGGGGGRAAKKLKIGIRVSAPQTQGGKIPVYSIFLLLIITFISILLLFFLFNKLSDY
ncbi:hypothetical protein HanIR_Chr10g0477151 [Helianthus annuus]|nr:hypothetical protein HanIR_Chr10g0477151 [Helianthus annuus]